MNKLLDETIVPKLKEKIPSLYSEYGENTNGSVTQKFINDTFNGTAIAIGQGANKTNSNGEAIAIGVNADTVNSASAVIIGPDAKSGDGKNFTTAIGNEAKAYADYSTALGSSTVVDAVAGIAVGLQAKTGNGIGAITIGYNASGPTKTGSDSVDASTTIGFGAKSENQAAVSLGYQTQAKNVKSVAIGSEAKSLVYSDIAIGTDCIAGDSSDVNKTNWPNITGAGAVAIGNTAVANGLRGIAIGTQSTVPKPNDYGIALGFRARAKHAGSVVISTKESAAFIDSQRDNELRLSDLQIGGLKAGTNADDAVNKAQLDTVEAKIPEVVSSVETIETDVETAKTNISTLQTNVTNLNATVESKQDKLTSGTNIKTVNNTSVLGSGNITVQPTLVSGTNIKTVNNTSLLGSGNISIAVPMISNATGSSTTNGISQKAATDAIATKQDKLTSGTNIKTINGSSILGSGDLVIAASAGGATIEKLTTSDGDATTGTISVTEDLNEYDLLIINATARSTVYSDVASKNITYTQSVNAVASVDYRYGTGNKYASWVCDIPMSAEVQFFSVPRQVAISTSFDTHSIHLQLNISSTSLMMNQYRDWMSVTHMNPTNVSVYGIKL